MKFLIRDDDPSAMTQPQELENCWGQVWDEVPVGLSVTPFRIPGSGQGVPEQFVGSEEALPLEENQELVAYLRDLIVSKKAYIAMHGYNHTKPDGKPEYVAGGNLKEKTLHGRRYLESLLGCEINTFVPPNNGMGMEGFKAVGAAKMNVVNNQPYGRLLGFPSSPAAFSDFLAAARYALRRRRGTFSPLAVQAFLRFKQLPYQTVGPSTDLEKLEQIFKTWRAEGGVFVMATHYHAFEKRLKGGETVGEIVYGLLERVRALSEIEFATYDQIWASAPD